MNADRHAAYKAANEIIDRIGPAKLHDEEADLLRDCAEGLLLSPDLTSPEAEEYRVRVEEQMEKLVRSERWLAEGAEELQRAIVAAGPRVEELVAA